MTDSREYSATIEVTFQVADDGETIESAVTSVTLNGVSPRLGLAGALVGVQQLAAEDLRAMTQGILSEEQITAVLFFHIGTILAKNPMESVSTVELNIPDTIEGLD